MSTPDSCNSTQRRGAESVTVVGAGPAGLACAITLARAGRPVVVREWHRDVGTRFHGDFQGLENWSDEQDVLDELAAAGIEATFDHHAVLQGTVFDSRGNRYPVQSAQPLFYLVRRGAEEGCLDSALLRQALTAGVDVRFQDRASAVRGTGVLAIGPRRADAIAAGYVFETDMSDGAWLILDNRLAPLGYAYLLIHDGRGTVASCLFAGFKQQAQCVERTVAAFRERVGLEMRKPRPFGGFANFPVPRTAMQGGHPVIGEQAGFQDALAGFGMRYALRAGLALGGEHAQSRRRPLGAAPLLPAVDGEPDALSGRAALLPRAARRPQLRPCRLPLRLVRMPGRARSHRPQLTARKSHHAGRPMSAPSTSISAQAHGVLGLMPGLDGGVIERCDPHRIAAPRS